MSEPLMQQDEAVHVQSGQAPILVQIDKAAGKQFVLIVWFSSFFSALAVLGLMVLWSAYRDTRAHVNTLQYDLAQVKAQLVERGLYEPTSH
jgi:hypothetical protein